MSAGVVDDQVHVEAGGHVQGSKSCGCALADGVVGDTLDVAQTHRQLRLGTIESLDLRFLINAEHNCFVWWVEVEPYDVSTLLYKAGIVRALLAVRLPRSGKISGVGAAGRRSASSGAPYFWRGL